MSEVDGEWRYSNSKSTESESERVSKSQRKVTVMMTLKRGKLGTQ